MRVLDLRLEPADELTPAETPSEVLIGRVGVPGRGEHRRAVRPEDVDLVVVVRDDDVLLPAVLEAPDADVEAVAAVAVVALAVEVLVVPRTAQLVVPRPGGLVPVRRLEEPAACV